MDFLRWAPQNGGEMTVVAPDAWCWSGSKGEFVSDSCTAGSEIALMKRGGVEQQVPKAQEEAERLREQYAQSERSPISQGKVRRSTSAQVSSKAFICINSIKVFLS
jgi:hypothetical protein